MGPEGLLLFGPGPLHVPRCLLNGLGYRVKGVGVRVSCFHRAQGIVLAEAATDRHWVDSVHRLWKSGVWGLRVLGWE